MILVIGANGFIGKNLQNVLIERNTAFINATNDLKIDITKIEDFKKIPKNVTKIINLAAYHSKRVEEQENRKMFDVNVRGVFNLIKYCSNNNIKLIHASSMSVYGRNTGDVDEETPLSPETEYAFTKMIGDLMIQKFIKEGLNAACLRFSSVYGPHHQQGAVKKMADSIKNENKIIVFNGGKDESDFVYVKDVVQAIILAADSNKNGVFNIGSGQKHTIKELAQMLQKICGKNISIVENEARRDPITFCMNINKAQQELNYSPKFNLKEGLLDWWKNG